MPLGGTLRFQLFVELERLQDAGVALGLREAIGTPEQLGDFVELAGLERHVVGGKHCLRRKQLRHRSLLPPDPGLRGCRFLSSHGGDHERRPDTTHKQQSHSPPIVPGMFSHFDAHPPGVMPDRERYPILTERPKIHKSRAAPSLTG